MDRLERIKNVYLTNGQGTQLLLFASSPWGGAVSSVQWRRDNDVYSVRLKRLSSNSGLRFRSGVVIFLFGGRFVHTICRHHETSQVSRSEH